MTADEKDLAQYLGFIDFMNHGKRGCKCTCGNFFAPVKVRAHRMSCASWSRYIELMRKFQP